MARHVKNLAVRVLPYAASAAAVALLALVAHAFTRVVELPHVSVLFLAAVVASAALWGFWPSLLAAVLSVAAGAYFFYAPILSLRVSAEPDLADLAVFVIVAGFTSRLAASVRAKALEAQREQHKMAALLAFSERLAAATTDADLQAAIKEHLAPVLGRPIHLLMPGSEARDAPPEVLAAADRAMVEGDAVAGGWRLRRLVTEHGAVAVVAALGPAPELEPDYVKALLGQAAQAIERARLRHEIAEARVKVQGAALHEALINSVSHDLQTPLAAILGSATALETFGAHGDPAARAALMATIREEAERLGSYIENVLDLTRIRSGQIAPRLELIELADIIDAALRRRQKALAAHRVRVQLAPDLPMLRLDLFLMEHALANVLDNASKYAPAGSEVRISARVEGSHVVLDVTDAGTGILAEDLERVFEPFYRGAGAEGSPATGTGLGLAICRAFVEANGGTASALGAGGSTTLRLRLPLPEAPAMSEATVADD
jgi:two-component system sensor histidine kinase KdpD